MIYVLMLVSLAILYSVLSLKIPVYYLYTLFLIYIGICCGITIYSITDIKEWYVLIFGLGILYTVPYSVFIYERRKEEFDEHYRQKRPYGKDD